MKTVRVLSACLEGAGAFLVTIQARFEPSQQGPTEIQLTGLPDPVLRESRGRLACVLAAGKLRTGPGRLHLHLAPAARRKSGEGLDLALVLASAAAAGHLEPRQLEGTLFLGEVGIDGALTATPGGLAAALEARRHGVTEVVAPPGAAREVAALADVRAFEASDLGEALAHVTRAPGDPARPAARRPVPAPGVDRDRLGRRLDEVRGQGEAKFALQVAAAGGHGLLMVGPPGAGKTMLARRLVDLLPAPTLEERIAATAIRSAAGRRAEGLVADRPFRAPHHTTSHAGLLGGGNPISPGEITLAHGGVLFLDELPEFGRDALEGLRQPLEEGRIHIARAGRRLELPAAFQLVAAMNPCPCGHAGHPRIVCRCPPSAVARYRRRLSGPVLDRIDLRVTVRPTPVEALVPSGDDRAPASAGEGRRMIEEVLDARGRAALRAARTLGAGPVGASRSATGPRAAGTDAPGGSGASGSSGPSESSGLSGSCGASSSSAQAGANGELATGATVEPTGPVNASLSPAELDRVAGLDGAGAALLRRAAGERQLSTRAVQAVRRVARTVSDLRGLEEVDAEAVATALSLREGLDG